MIRIDATTQMYISADILVKMARELGREDETKWLSKEAEMLNKLINEKMCDDELAFYCDRYRDGAWNDGDFGHGTLGGGTAFVCEWEVDPESIDINTLLPKN